MSNRSVYLVLLVIGIIIILVSLFAHNLGLSSSTGLGTKKIIGIIVGAIIGLIGLFGLLRRPAMIA